MPYWKSVKNSMKALPTQRFWIDGASVEAVDGHHGGNNQPSWP